MLEKNLRVQIIVGMGLGEWLTQLVRNCVIKNAY